MKASREQQRKNEIEKVTQNLRDAILSAGIETKKIEKVDFQGSDLIIRLERGPTWIFSAVLNDDGKPVIEFDYSPK